MPVHDLEEMKFCKLAGTDQCPIFVELGDDAKPEYGKYPEVLKKQSKKKRAELEEKIKQCEQMLNGYKCPYLFEEEDYAYAKKKKKKAAEGDETGYAYEKEKKKEKKATDEEATVKLVELEERIKKLEEFNKALQERNKLLEEKTRLAERKAFEKEVESRCQKMLEEGIWPAFVDEVKKILLASQDQTIKLEDKELSIMEVINRLVEKIPDEAKVSFEDLTKTKVIPPGGTELMTVEEVENWAKEKGITFEEACEILAKEGRIRV